MEADKEQWHMDKRVPISMILAMLSMAASGLWFMADLRRDIELTKQQTAQMQETLRLEVAQQRERDERQDILVRESVTQLREGLHEANAKLDRLIERSMQRGVR